MNMSCPKIAVMVPMHQHPERTLKSVWANWYKLNYPEDKIKFFFAIPKDSPKRSLVMREFKKRHQIIVVDIDYTKQTDSRFHELGKVRDLLLEYGRKYDYGWFLDSDVCPPSESVNWFLEDNMDITGGVVLVPDNAANIRLGFGYFRPYYDFGNILPTEEIFRVHAVNTACMFLSKAVMNDKDVSFKIWNVPNITKDGIFALSEDHGFCYNALQKNYTLWVDRRVMCQHLRNFDGKIINLKVPDHV
jgi:hypothetical protein